MKTTPQYVSEQPFWAIRLGYVLTCWIRHKKCFLLSCYSKEFSSRDWLSVAALLHTHVFLVIRVCRDFYCQLYSFTSIVVIPVVLVFVLWVHVRCAEDSKKENCFWLWKRSVKHAKHFFGSSGEESNSCGSDNSDFRLSSIWKSFPWQWWNYIMRDIRVVRGLKCL